MNEHESNLIVGVRLLDSAVAVLQGVDFSKVKDKGKYDEADLTRSELAVYSLTVDLDYLNKAYSNLVTGDPE